MPTPHHSGFFTDRMPFLPPNQQRQSTEGTCVLKTWKKINNIHILQQLHFSLSFLRKTNRESATNHSFKQATISFIQQHK